MPKILNKKTPFTFKYICKIYTALGVILKFINTIALIGMFRELYVFHLL